jgi:hypothetical protein
MKRVLFASLIATLALGGLVLSSKADNIQLRGDYVEVRTASVFAGACHFNGEVTTTGRDAMMAWNVSNGSWQGVNLAGVRAMAIVRAEDSLGNSNAARESQILIDSSASRAQSLALFNALKEKYASSLGKIVSVKNVPITFVRNGNTFAVAADKAAIDVEAMPNDLCCKMPNLVWYTPLVGLENRKVGYTTNATYSGTDVSEPWSRSGENSAFYGNFAL